MGQWRRSKLFSLAERGKLLPRGTNPSTGVEKFEGKVIECYLTSAEYAALFKRLDKSHDCDVPVGAIAYSC